MLAVNESLLLATLPIERFQILCELIIKLFWCLGYANTGGDSVLLKEQIWETESGHEHLCFCLGVDVQLVSGMSSCSANCVHACQAHLQKISFSRYFLRVSDVRQI